MNCRILKNKNQDEVSPFKKVIDNIGFLTSKGVSISVRMNTDMYNVEDLKILVKDLRERFPENDKLNIYCYQIFEDKENPRTDEEKRLLYEKLNELDDVIAEYDFRPKNSHIDNQIRVTHCMVDNGKCINIHPDGTLGLCEHYIDSDNWGYIDEDSNEVITNWEFVHEWRDYLTDGLCKDCKLYPVCVRTRKCEDLCTCDKFFQEHKYVQEKREIEMIYDDFLRRLEEMSSCSCGDSCSCGEGNNFTCYCVEESCDSKENWCYCISQKQEIEQMNKSEHKCEGGTCTCKKEETKQEEVEENKQEEVIETTTDEKEENTSKKKSLWDKIVDIFD